MSDDKAHAAYHPWHSAEEMHAALSMSAEGPRAETPEGEHSAQNEPCGGTPGAFGLLIGTAGRLVLAVLGALVGRTPWTRATARERATRPRSR